MARSFLAKVEPWTNARSIRSNTRSNTSRRQATAPTGTKPPDSALASSTRSGSTPQCCDARKRPVRPIPVWISSAISNVPCLRPGRRRQIVVARQVDALALDRLDHERGDIAPGERSFERVQIIERYARAGADERREALAKRLIAA
jgi:hypothetical protein